MGCQADAGDPCNTGKRGFLKRLSGAGATSHPHPFDKPIPDVGSNDALMRIAATAICGTDIHVFNGGYPVAKGLAIGHEPVGVIEEPGSAVSGHQEGQRMIAGAICPDFNSTSGLPTICSRISMMAC